MKWNEDPLGNVEIFDILVSMVTNITIHNVKSIMNLNDIDEGRKNKLREFLETR